MPPGYSAAAYNYNKGYTAGRNERDAEAIAQAEKIMRDYRNE